MLSQPPILQADILPALLRLVDHEYSLIQYMKQLIQTEVHQSREIVKDGHLTLQITAASTPSHLFPLNSFSTKMISALFHVLGAISRASLVNSVALLTVRPPLFRYSHSFHCQTLQIG